jgi:hypothetical protein
VRNSFAILLMAWSAAAVGQELGTLFHTPKERDLLERLRRGEKVEAAPVIRPDPTLTGFVKRSDGKSTVFLDKQPMPVHDPKLQRLLEPRNVERFEAEAPPPPPPPAPATSAQRQDSLPAGKADSPKGVRAAASKRDEEE